MDPEPLQMTKDLTALLWHPQHAQAISWWMLTPGRLLMFRLAISIGGESREECKRDTSTASPTRYDTNPVAISPVPLKTPLKDIKLI